tara:strand:- start:1065 stop:1262 length:198 start_codon:yes stop_codon:yes gene_type:complete
MNQADYEKWAIYKNNYKVQPDQSQIDLIVNLHAKYFNHSVYYPCSCTPKIYNKWIAQIDKLYNEH